jgi:hypothetical protein
MSLRTSLNCFYTHNNLNPVYIFGTSTSKCLFTTECIHGFPFVYKNTHCKFVASEAMTPVLSVAMFPNYSKLSPAEKVTFL